MPRTRRHGEIAPGGGFAQRDSGGPRPLSRSLGIGIAAVALACLAAAAAAVHWQPAARRAADLAGERWYRITLHDQQIGYLHSVSGRDWRGRWRFETDLRFVLQPGQPVRFHQQLEFAALPPFALLHAEQRSERGGAVTDVSSLARVDAGYLWRRERHGETAPRGGFSQRESGGPWPLSRSDGGSAPAVRGEEWRYDLGDYLAVETWLHDSNPPVDATATFPSLDFAAQQLAPKHYRLLERSADGYLVENPTPHEATRIRLDTALRPTLMSLAGLFDIELVTRERALAPRTALQAASYHVPLDRPLADHTRIRALRLAVQGPLTAAEVWPQLVDAASGELTLATNTPSGLQPTGDELRETDQHPVGDPRIQALARSAVGTATDPAQQVAALTRFVHGFLRYREDAPPRHVLALLDDPEGDCSEYADLLTTLARSLGIPARTVFGLAYDHGPPPAFRFHAWNELSVGGRWVPADPTWNQVHIDATHIPMPLDVATALQLLTGSGGLNFVVRAAEY